MKKKTIEDYKAEIVNLKKEIRSANALIDDLRARKKAVKQMYLRKVKQNLDNLKEVQQLRTEKAFIKKSADSVSGILEDTERQRDLLANVSKAIIETIEAQ